MGRGRRQRARAKRPNLTPLAAHRAASCRRFPRDQLSDGPHVDVIVPPVVRLRHRSLAKSIMRARERGCGHGGRCFWPARRGPARPDGSGIVRRTSLSTLYRSSARANRGFMGRLPRSFTHGFRRDQTTRGVYLFDEIDALASSGGNGNDIGEARRVSNSFLQFLDEDTGPSIIIATTNLPELLDRAVLRRFDLVYHPRSAERGRDRKGDAPPAARLRRRCDQLGQITGCADGLSTADVIAAAEDAARRAVILDSGAVETSAVVASLERRRSLQGIGTDKHGSRSAPLH